MKAHRHFLLGGYLIVMMIGFSSMAEGAPQANKPIVAVANYPLKYFTERIAGNDIRIIFPIPHDVDPAFWHPQPNEVLLFQAADAILLNGATYSKWLDTVTLSKRKLVNTSQAFKAEYITIEDLATHRHGPQGEHAHSGLAFTTWLDFHQAILQAEAILHTVVRLAPQKEAVFKSNYSHLKQDLLMVDQSLQQIVVQNSKPPLIASHPVYDYLKRRYGLNIRSVLWEPEEVPNAQQWKELETILQDYPATWMIWEGEPHPESVARLQLMGIKSAVFDPVGNVPEHGDFLSIMRQNVENLKAVFQQQGAE